MAVIWRDARWGRSGWRRTRAERLSLPQLRRLLGFETRYELDGFLKAHGEYLDYTIEDLERERRDLAALGL